MLWDCGLREYCAVQGKNAGNILEKLAGMHRPRIQILGMQNNLWPRSESFACICFEVLRNEISLAACSIIFAFCCVMETANSEFMSVYAKQREKRNPGIALRK